MSTLPGLEPAGLEVCPFCGSDNVKLRTDSKAAMSWVACISCGLEAPTETGVSSEEAVAYWNRRAARSAPEAGKAVVKPLVWQKQSEHIWGADDYKITNFEGLAGYPLPGRPFELRRLTDNPSKLPFATLEAAKAAAQADYEARVLSALASVAPSGAEPVGWQWKTLDTWHTIDKSSVSDPEAYAKAQASGGQYRPIYAAPLDDAELLEATEAEVKRLLEAPQAVPAEDVAK